MKPALVLALGLILPLAFGCSVSRYRTAAETTTNLGIVEVANRETRHFPLSGQRDCQIRFTYLADEGVLVEAIVLRNVGQGNVNILARPRAETLFGKMITLPIDDGTILLTPKRSRNS